MIFKWQAKEELLLRGMHISARKKLEGIRLMNELCDRVLSVRQKSIRQKLRKGEYL